MSYNALPLITTGDDWTAAQHNTYIRTNFMAAIPGVIQATGDIVYATGANAIDRLALVPNTILTSGSAAPAWLSAGSALMALRTNYAGVGYEWGADSVIGASVYRDSTQSIPQNTYTGINFEGAILNPYSMWTAVVPGRITIPVGWPAARWYRIYGILVYDTPPNNLPNGFREVSISVSASLKEGMSINTQNMEKKFIISMYCERQLSASNYVELKAFHQYGGAGGLNIKNAVLSVIMIK